MSVDMSPYEFSEELRRKPFSPFRIFLSDGKTYDIYHPELCMAGHDAIVIGVTAKPDEFLFDRSVKVAMPHVVRLEPIPVPAKSSPTPVAA